jgi:hypothetical protein
MSKPIKNNSKLLYLQARQLFERAMAKFEDGTIKSEPKLVEAVFNSFQEFFTSMGKPNMIPRYAPEEGPPWSEDYNNMMQEIRQDLELLFQEVDILGRTLYTNFNHNMIQHEIINKQFEQVLDKMRDLELYAGINQSGVELGRDDFLNKDKIDYSRISGTPLEIVDGAVTLPQINRVNVAKDAQVTIIIGNRQQNKFILGTESNGFPGNNTEIHSVTDDVLTNRNYIPTFLGEENNHSDYSVVLDGSPNTWFEYEKVNVREHDKVRVAKNLGWDYQVHENQTITWAEDPDGGVLRLHMQIILKEEKIINQINCNMYTPPNYGAKTAIVKNILVSDGKEEPKSIMPKNKKDNQYSFHFPPVKAKVISILFEQPHKYITDIGHIFYEKKMQVEDNSEYAMDMATKKYKYAPRVEGPLISLEDLGIQVKVSENNVEASYPLLSGSSNNTTRSIGETINRLMNNIDMDTVEMGVEKFEGFRWCIGIRDIEIWSCEYASEGELVTHPFYFDKPLDKITLNVNENIPSIFTSNPALKYDWLKYFISIDDGATWYPITPMSHEMINNEEQPPKIYTVRTVETAEQQLDDKQAYIESEYPVYSLRLKIIARRPDDYSTEGFMIKDQAGVTDASFVQSSPILNSYTFHVVTIDDAANSEESDRMVANIDELSDKPNTGFDSNQPKDETPPDWGGMPPGTGGTNPWGDDDGDGIPNWDDPDHPDYVPPNTRPPGWEPPGRPPGSTYPPGGRPPIIGGPNDDDDGDGIPNYRDPDWKPPLTVKITNPKTEWCVDTDLIVKGIIYSSRDLNRIELYLNGTKKDTIYLTGKVSDFSFSVLANELTEGALTVIVKGYDTHDSAMDTDVINIINCEGLPPEDRPDERSTEELNVIIDRKVDKLCKCDTLVFYGSAQGPNPIQAIVFRINGIPIDPENLGTPPENDPCGTSGITAQSTEVSVKQMTEEELLEIEDFGEWLEAFEELHDCGCKNKKKQTPQFQMQATPFHMMEVSEQGFHVEIPYWKLHEIGITPGNTMTVSVTAYDSMNNEATDSFQTVVEDCEKPPTDENGNPRVRDCYQLESVEVHYYSHETHQIESITIPANALPYEGVTNGAGSGITVGWRKAEKAPIIMMTSGYDDSGYAFQIHAVGVHYLNEYDQPHTVWTSLIGSKTPGVKNDEKMIGDPSRQPTWINDIENGDYYTSPSLGGINDYAVFIMDNDWLTKACDVNIPDFIPSDYEKPSEPEPDPDREKLYDCNLLTHIVFQVYDELVHDLKMYKIDVSASGKDTYNLTTKNGTVTVSVGWVNYFKGPAIQIKSAAGTDNILLTAIGIVYRDMYGESQTSWSTRLRYRTNGVHYPEFVVGDKKTLGDLYWVINGTVDYNQATYIGKQGDMVAYVVDDTITTELCSPQKPIDEDVGIDPNNPPDVPKIDFVNPPAQICMEDENITLHAVASDDIGLKSVTYGISVNGIDVYGPYTDDINQLQHTISYMITTSQLQVGDTVHLYAQAINAFNVSAAKMIDILVANCDTAPPVITLSSTVACYSDLSNNQATVTLRVTDDRSIDRWEASCGAWTQNQSYDNTNDTGDITLNVPITVPASVTDSYGRSYIPDSTHTITVNAWDKSGKTATQTLQLTLTDCSYDPTPPSGGTDEGAITNEYKLLARLKWGAQPKDVDLHVFVGRNASRHLYYSAGISDPINNIKAQYSDANGSMYLNFDWTGHNEDADFNTEYEVATIDGFANEILTFIVHNYSGESISPSQPPVLEIVTDTGDLIATITMPPDVWTTRQIRAIEIQLDDTGGYQSTVRTMQAIAAIDPNL